MVLRAFYFLLLFGVGLQPMGALGSQTPADLDGDGNGVQDILDQWLAGQVTWNELRLSTLHSRAEIFNPQKAGDGPLDALLRPTSGPWSEGQIRLIALGNSRSLVYQGVSEGNTLGQARMVHDLDHFGGVQVLTLDEPGLQAFLSRSFDGFIGLDRDGLPALAQSCQQIGAQQLAQGHWKLGDDWSSTVAILDSGCDTAHGDLGDYAQDDLDGPPPLVGDASDWYPAANGWPLFQGYKVVGWHDVSDDFPEAVGPWDYHFHGTALASVVAGSGYQDSQYAGINPGGRLTVVKFYNFDGIWHTWAGDYLAACAWTLDNREVHRVRTVLTAVNWEVDLGISQAMAAFVDAGLLPVVAMGNYGDDPAGPGYPALLPDVLTVGSVDPDGAVSSFSGHGLQGQSKPDLLAPGGHVITADNEPNDTYSMRQGTSLSAAHVAGSVYLVDEALVDNGIFLPEDRTSVLTRMALVRAATARVTQAALPGGTRTTLDAHDEPDQIRGWGLLRVDAAVRAALMPLFAGEDQGDTLSLDTDRPATARRLVLNPGVRYLVEAVPQAGLDVALEVIDPRQLDSDPFGASIIRKNDNGPGVSEFTYHHALSDHWAFLVVRRVSGSGTVTLRVQESDNFVESSVEVQLPGLVTGNANVGQLAGTPGPAIVVPSRVAVDHVARSVNVLDATGVPLPGWPVFVFPNPSAQGGLSQPLVWDLDGAAGDEIVLSSDFGSVFFFNRLGAWIEEEVGFNLPVTTPVGMEELSGDRRVIALDDNGLFYSWSWGPVLDISFDTGFALPMDPAVGQLISGDAEELVVAFASGDVQVMNAAGEVLPGWPVNVGENLETPPVLCDLDDDGLHEIILVDLDHDSGLIRFHVLKGDGLQGPGDGTTLAAPSGGNWLQISDPVVAGRYGANDLRVTVSGLMDNAMEGTEATWNLGTASLFSSGAAQAETLTALEVQATTDQGVLTLQGALLPTPLAYDYNGGTGSEEQGVFSVDWTELLYGLTAIEGSASGIYQRSGVSRPFEGRAPLKKGGSEGTTLASSASALVDLSGDIMQQVRVVEDKLLLNPTLKGYTHAPVWASARGDQRNTAAYPLSSELTPVIVRPEAWQSLSVYPNPGSHHFQFKLDGISASGPAEISVYDLRGRLVRSLRGSLNLAVPAWDGKDGRGQKVAAGTYLAIARRGGQKATTRFVVTR